jgi:hypothetical protein
MKTKFYRESVGECVSQVYDVEATDWEAAKKTAFAEMDEGDRLAMCPASAIKVDDDYKDYHYIDKDECEEYATLCKGAYTSDGDGGEKWLENAWYYDDNPEVLFNGKYELI